MGYYVICACTVVVRPPGSTWTRSPETNEIFCNFAHAQLFQGHQSPRGNVHLKQVGSYVILRMRSKVPIMDTFSESSGILCNLRMRSCSKGHQGSRGHVHLKHMRFHVILRLRSKVHAQRGQVYLKHVGSFVIWACSVRTTWSHSHETCGILCYFAHAQLF